MPPVALTNFTCTCIWLVHVAVFYSTIHKLCVKTLLPYQHPPEFPVTLLQDSDLQDSKLQVRFLRPCVYKVFVISVEFENEMSFSYSSKISKVN